MKIDSLSPLDSIPYFTIEAVRQLLDDGTIAAGTIQTNLYRWTKTGQIIRLKKGTYMTRRFFERHQADADFSPMVSAILIPQSYISLEYALQLQGILTEVTYPVTAITLKQTRVVENKIGTFSYRSIQEKLYTGYAISEYKGIPIAKASIAKALFDFLYLRPIENSLGSSKDNIAESLRLNLEIFSEIERAEFAAYVTASKSRKMKMILNNLRKTIWQR